MRLTQSYRQGQITQGLLVFGKDFEIYSKYSGEPLESFKQERNTEIKGRVGVFMKRPSYSYSADYRFESASHFLILSKKP